MSIFYPASFEFVKKRAKQLKTIFPALSLSECQSAVACALGFKNLFDASSRIGKPGSTPSAYDEYVTDSERLQRRYQQIRSLVDYTNLPAHKVDVFVRLWNLTSAACSDLSRVEDDYQDVLSDITKAERGEISEDQLLARYDYEMPVKIADGILLTLLGLKHTYYLLGIERLLAMPIYLRGSIEAFLEYENGAQVKIAFPDFFTASEVLEAFDYLRENEPWLYEWHIGNCPDSFRGTTISKMIKEAKEFPDDWFALSVRRNNENMSYEYVIPALTGADFVQFIYAKGSLRGLNLQWFKPKNIRTISQLSILRFDSHISGVYCGNKLSISEISLATPLYGSPFKRGPMSEMEFNAGVEGGGLMLASELDFDD